MNQSNLENKNDSKKFVSSLQYSQPHYQQNSLIIDNRSTSLFQDNYKVIGSRYKFELEDLLNLQKDQSRMMTLEKKEEFKKKLSKHQCLEHATNLEAIRKYMHYLDVQGVPGEAKKKLASRQRKRNGIGKIDPS